MLFKVVGASTHNVWQNFLLLANWPASPAFARPSGSSNVRNDKYLQMFGMTPMFGMTFFVAWKKIIKKNLCVCHDLAANHFITTTPKVQGLQICAQI